MTAEERVKRVYPAAYVSSALMGDNRQLHKVYLDWGGKVIGEALGDRRRAWAQAATKLPKKGKN